VNCRKPWIIAACILASLSVGISEPALAQNECGPLVGGSVTCTSANNPYPTGITYGLPPPPSANPLNVTLNSDVEIVRAGPGIGVALNNFNSTGSPVFLSANGATIIVTQVPSSSGGNRGLYVETSSGDATITASGKIDVAGEGGATTQ
jgi:hypothetical protein